MCFFTYNDKYAQKNTKQSLCLPERPSIVYYRYSQSKYFTLMATLRTYLECQFINLKITRPWRHHDQLDHNLLSDEVVRALVLLDISTTNLPQATGSRRIQLTSGFRKRCPVDVFLFPCCKARSIRWYLENSHRACSISFMVNG
jgi:hypothetical protein